MKRFIFIRSEYIKALRWKFQGSFVLYKDEKTNSPSSTPSSILSSIHIDKTSTYYQDVFFDSLGLFTIWLTSG